MAFSKHRLLQNLGGRGVCSRFRRTMHQSSDDEASRPLLDKTVPVADPVEKTASSNIHAEEQSVDQEEQFPLRKSFSAVNGQV